MVDVVRLDSVAESRTHVWVLTLRLLHGARKSNQIRTAARNHAPSKKSEPREPRGDRRGRFTDPRNPPWHAAWPALIQPVRPLDRGPSVARRADRSPRTQTVPHHRGLLDVRECAGLRCPPQVYCLLYRCVIAGFKRHSFIPALIRSKIQLL